MGAEGREFESPHSDVTWDLFNTIYSTAALIVSVAVWISTRRRR